jgi:tyrosinase
MDRIVTMFQTRYPDTWIEEAEQMMGTFTMQKGQIQGPDSPLTPFHMNADGDMWTSTTVRNWTSFGYTYPELMDNPSNETFTATLNKLYKPPTQGLPDSSASLPKPGTSNTTSNITTQAVTDWSCEVNMPSDIKISYAVRAFLGEPPSDPTSWSTSTNYIGQLASMSSARMKTDVIVTGTIALSAALAEKHAAGELKSLDKPDVAAYLKEHFHWRIQALDNTEIPRDNPPAGLNVTVFNVPIQVPESETEVPTTQKGDVEYNDDIDGNPPTYDGPGVDGTNSTAPTGSVGGSYNAALGEFEWRNARPENDSSSTPSSSQLVSRTPVATQPVAPTPPAVGVPNPLAPILSFVTSVASQVRSEVTAAPPETTAPPEKQTRYVTEIVMVTMPGT